MQLNENDVIMVPLKVAYILKKKGKDSSTLVYQPILEMLHTFWVKDTLEDPWESTLKTVGAQIYTKIGDLREVSINSSLWSVNGDFVYYALDSGECLCLRSNGEITVIHESILAIVNKNAGVMSAGESTIFFQRDSVISRFMHQNNNPALQHFYEGIATDLTAERRPLTVEEIVTIYIEHVRGFIKDSSFPHLLFLDGLVTNLKVKQDLVHLYEKKITAIMYP